MEPRSFTRPVNDEYGQWLYEETVVAMTDKLGRSWEVTVEDHRITSVRVFAEDVKTDHLRQVPLVHLRATALAKVREVMDLLDAGAPLDEALDETNYRDVDILPGGRVSVLEFAEAWRDAGVPTIGIDGAARRPQRRKILAEKFHTSTWNIDKWIRYARDRGALDEPPARQG